MLVGSRIKEARKKKGLTQKGLGELLNVSKVSICGYEKGTRTPTLEKFLELINILDMSMDYALGRDKFVISDTDEGYAIKMSNEDIEIIKELKENRKLYNQLCSDTKRTIELINRKLNK